MAIMENLNLSDIFQIIIAPVLGVFAYFYRDHDGRLRQLEGVISNMATQLAVQQTMHNTVVRDNDEMKSDIKEIKVAVEKIARRGSR